MVSGSGSAAAKELSCGEPVSPTRPPGPPSGRPQCESITQQACAEELIGSLPTIELTAAELGALLAAAARAESAQDLGRIRDQAFGGDKPKRPESATRKNKTSSSHVYGSQCSVPDTDIGIFRADTRPGESAGGATAARFDRQFFKAGHTGLLDDHYDLDEKLGEGAFGTVYKACNKITGAIRAVKGIAKKG